MKWTFRKLALSDSKKILNWRNSPEVYRHLFHPTPVAAADHEEWMARVLVDDKCLFLIAVGDDADTGTLRFDFSSDGSEAEVGIYLAPEFHGKGLSAAMLAAGEKEAQRIRPGLKKIVARIVPENLASEKMFIKTGYTKKFIQLEKCLD